VLSMIMNVMHSRWLADYVIRGGFGTTRLPKLHGFLDQQSGFRLCWLSIKWRSDPLHALS